jgi:hypothetical protein
MINNGAKRKTWPGEWTQQLNRLAGAFEGEGASEQSSTEHRKPCGNRYIYPPKPLPLTPLSLLCQL